MSQQREGSEGSQGKGKGNSSGDSGHDKGKEECKFEVHKPWLAFKNTSDNNSSGSASSSDHHDNGKAMDKVDVLENGDGVAPVAPLNVGEKRSDDGAAKGLSLKRLRHDVHGKGKSCVGDMEHEIHIWTERERRKKMRDMFTNLHALLPHLPAKADKSTIVDEAVNYIKTLQIKLQKLQKLKLDHIQGLNFKLPTTSQVVETLTTNITTRESFIADHSKNWPAVINSPTALSIARYPQCFQTWSSPNVVLSVSGDDAYVHVCAAKKAGLLTTVLYVLEKHKLEVVSLCVSSDYFRSMLMIHVHASRASEQFPETMTMEDIYKSAVGELIGWLAS